MDTTAKSLSKEERENVLMVLNQFSAEYHTSAKSMNLLVISMQELSEKISAVLAKTETAESDVEKENQSESLIAAAMAKITAAVERMEFHENTMHELSGHLVKNNMILKHPEPQKILHHHYIPKMAWSAATLLIIVAITSAGWFVTENKLGNYISNDTKYRLLKLDTANYYLQKLLYHTDSLYRKNFSLRYTVISREEEYRQNLELLQKAKQLNAEAEQLEADAKKLKEQAGKK